MRTSLHARGFVRGSAGELMVQSRMWKFRDKAARAEAASFFTPKAYPGCGSCYMVLERVDVEGEVEIA